MGERTAVRFVSGPSGGAAEACIYIHWGGPPNEMAVVFQEFFERNDKDSQAHNRRYDDAGALAARFLMFMATYAYDMEPDQDPLSLEINGLCVIPDAPQQHAASGWWMYSVMCGDVRSMTASRPPVLYHDVMAVPDESDKTKQTVIWQRFLPLREAADNFNTEKADG